MEGVGIQPFQGPRIREAGGRGGGTCPPPYFKIHRISKKKCLVPLPPNIESPMVPLPNLRVAPRSLLLPVVAFGGNPEK